MGYITKNWKKDEIAALIALFETERCLYDKTEIDYHIPEKKLEAYERICKIMLRIRPDVTVDEIKYRIKVLQRQYEGEILHRNVSIETGLCTVDTYKPVMWCFGLLQFLDDHLDRKNVDETSEKDEDSYKEGYHKAETDSEKETKESSDAVDESDHREEMEEWVSRKKRKVKNSSSSSSSSEKEFHKASIKKILKSSSEKKLKNSSFSTKKFQSSSSVQKKLQNSSSSGKKSHSNLPLEKKTSKSSTFVKKSEDTSSSCDKLQNTLSSRKKSLHSSLSVRKLQNTFSSEKKTPASSPFEKDRKCISSEKKVHTSSTFEKDRKSVSSEKELKNSPVEKDRKSSSERELKDSPMEIKWKRTSPERDLKSSPMERESRNHSPEKNSKCQSFCNRELQNSSSAAMETKNSLHERELLNAVNYAQVPIDREDMFGKYVACELRALKSNPLVYLHTKQRIWESLTSATFDLIDPK